MSRFKQSPDREQLLAACRRLVDLMEKKFGEVGYSGLPWSTYSSEMLRHTRNDMLKQLGLTASDVVMVKLLPSANSSGG